MLLDTLRGLKAKGNTVVVVEHDEETIRRAEHIVDLGPGGGRERRASVAEGTVSDIMSNPESVTGRFLPLPSAPAGIRGNRVRRCADATRARPPDSGRRLHNLKDLGLRFPSAGWSA